MPRSGERGVQVSWIADPARCAAVGLGPDVMFATKPALAAAIVRRLVENGHRVPQLAADEVYGGDPQLRCGLEELQIGYVLAVACTHRIGVVDGPVAVGVLAAGLPAESWQVRSAGDGSKGRQLYQWAYLHLHKSASGQRYLLVQRNITTGELAFYRCFSPIPVPPTELIRVAGTRWRVEKAFQSGKGLTPAWTTTRSANEILEGGVNRVRWTVPVGEHVGMFRRLARRPVPAPPTASAPSAPNPNAETDAPAARLSASPPASAAWLAAWLATMDHAEEDSAAAGLLKTVAFVPPLVLRLEQTVRHVSYYRSGEMYTRLERIREQIAQDPAAGPEVIALASLHADGRTRERAVRQIALSPPPVLVPFLVLRTADFVPQVREAARGALANVLFADPGRSLEAAAAMAAVLARRERSGFALAQVRAGLAASPTARIEQLLGRADLAVPVRRLAAEHAARVPPATLVRLAAAESDPWTRDRLAEAAVREALWTGRHEFIRTLTHSRSPDVRAIALAGLLRSGLPGEAAGFLDDPSPLVRASARFAARKAGIDVLARYRELATGDTATPGAVLGLAEEATRTRAGDIVALIEPRLAHPAPRMRASAVTALQLLDAATLERVAPLLADRSSPVVRAAASAVQDRAHRVDPEFLLALLADTGRAAGAPRAIYRLARSHSTVVFLAAALCCVADGDAKLAARAALDLRQLALPAGYPHRPPLLAYVGIEPAVIPDLPTRLAAVRSALDPEVGDAVAGFLGCADTTRSA
jgi:hypothetical protein